MASIQRQDQNWRHNFARLVALRSLDGFDLFLRDEPAEKAHIDELLRLSA